MLTHNASDCRHGRRVGHGIARRAAQVLPVSMLAEKVVVDVAHDRNPARMQIRERIEHSIIQTYAFRKPDVVLGQHLAAKQLLRDERLESRHEVGVYNGFLVN